MGGRKLDNERMLALWRQGLKDSDIAKAVGRDTRSVTQWRFRNRLAKNAPPVRTCNMCGECAYPIGLCPWLHDGKPVPGWIADEVEYNGHEQGVMTFAIKACPLYVKHSRAKCEEEES